MIKFKIHKIKNTQVQGERKRRKYNFRDEVPNPKKEMRKKREKFSQSKFQKFQEIKIFSKSNLESKYLGSSQEQAQSLSSQQIKTKFKL